MQQHSTVDVMKAKAVVSATLDTSVASLLTFLKQSGPRMIASGNRRDLACIQSAITTLRLIETQREALEEDLINGYLYAVRKDLHHEEGCMCQGCRQHTVNGTYKDWKPAP